MAKRKKRNRPKKQGQQGRTTKKLMKRVRDNHSQEFSLQDSPDGVKMSVVLENFIEPFDQPDEPIEIRRKIIMCAVIAWNSSVLEEVGSGDIIEEALEGIPSPDRPAAQSVIVGLKKRKKEKFAHIKRFIVDFEFVENGDEAFLSVSSTHPLS